MSIIRDNKILFLWWAVAYVIAFCSYNKNWISDKESKQHDTLVYFSFTQNQKKELITYFNKKQNQYGLNGVILVGQKDSIFVSKSYGYSNFELKDSLTVNSSFQLASVSKQFTAVAILQLYQKGLLKLTDSIQTFYPKFPYKGITVHQLLTHRSGLPNYLYFFQYIPTTFDTIIDNQDVVKEMIDKFPKAYYKPNQRYHYSNTGYALLAAIVEKVSGISFTNYLHKFIFSPLEMNSSFTHVEIKTQTSINITTGYLYRWRMAEDNYLDGVLGDKGVYCSASDLFIWDQGLYSNTIINKDTLAKAFEPMGKPSYFKSNYGYGWRMFNWKSDSTKVLFHSGWWHGYKTLLMRIEKDSTTIVVLKNRGKGAPINKKQLMRILYPVSNAIIDTVSFDLDN